MAIPDINTYRRNITDFYTEQLQEKDQQIEALQRQVAERPSERQDKLESFLTKWIRPAIEDLEKQHGKKGYYHGNKDQNDYMAGVVAGYRELFKREETENV